MNACTGTLMELYKISFNDARLYATAGQGNIARASDVYWEQQGESLYVALVCECLAVLVSLCLGRISLLAFVYFSPWSKEKGGFSIKQEFLAKEEKASKQLRHFSKLRMQQNAMDCHSGLLIQFILEGELKEDL